ncbi:MAG: hypothetical protein ACLPZR_06630 [Solirubrobacteraceae bacterium]
MRLLAVIVAVVAAAAATMASDVRAGSPARCPTSPNSSLLPGVATLTRQNVFLAGLGVRPTGSAAQTRYIDWIVSQLRTIHNVGVTRWPFAIDRWSSSRVQLQIQLAGHWTTIPVADAIPYSKPTGPLGVTAPLTIIPDSEPITPHNARGRIVVRAADTESIALSYLLSAPIAWQAYDPGRTFTPHATFFGDWLDYNARVADLQQAAAAGAAGILFLKDQPLFQLTSYYEPYEGIGWGVPGAFLGVDQGAEITSRVAQGTPILGRVVVRAQFRRVTTPIILATIPGSGPNRIVVESKTDGTNVTEDNAPLAMVAMARYFAALPAGCRPRTLEFAFSTAHFYQRLLGRDTRYGGAEAFARRLDADYARGEGSVVITLEHLDARDYRRAPRGHGRPGYILRPTGRRAIQLIGVTPSSALVQAVSSVVHRYDLVRSILIHGTQPPTATAPAYCSFGDEGTSFLDHLLPTVAFDSAPQDLYEPAFGLDSVNVPVMHSELLAYTALVLKLGTIGQQQLAGQVTAERRARGAGARPCPPS